MYIFKFFLNSSISIFDEFSKIVDDILLINFHIVKEAREILSKHSKINTRDAIHVATMNYYEISYIATFDKHFSEFENIKYYKFESC